MKTLRVFATWFLAFLSALLLVAALLVAWFFLSRPQAHPVESLVSMASTTSAAPIDDPMDHAARDSRFGNSDQNNHSYAMFVVLSTDDKTPLVAPFVKIYNLSGISDVSTSTPDDLGVAKLELHRGRHEIVVAGAKGRAPALIARCERHDLQARATSIMLTAGVSLHVALVGGDAIRRSEPRLRASYFSNRMTFQVCAHPEAQTEIEGGRNFTVEASRNPDDSYSIDALPGGVPLRLRLSAKHDSEHVLAETTIQLPRDGTMTFDLDVAGSHR
jgi:hypothetical protein